MADSFTSDFLAGGAPGWGEAAAGDHLQVTYHYWLVGHQLEHGRAPWRDPYTFRPESEPVLNVQGWPFGLPFWPLNALFGTVVAWNTLMLLLYLAAGLLACAWLRELGLSRGPALVGGLAFALAPYLQAQWSTGHLLAWVAMLLPLALYAVERARKGSLWWLAVAGAALVSVPLSGQLHLALGVIPFFVLYCLVRLPWAALLAVPALAAGLLANALVVRHTTGARSRSFHQVEHYSAGLSGFVSRDSKLIEQMVYLGWSVLALAVAGFVALVLRRRWGLATVLGLGALVPILFALGSHTPGYETLWRHLPGLQHTRVPERIMPVACLALAALVAIAVSRVRWPGTAAIVALVLLIELPLNLFHATDADPHNKVYAAVRSEPPGRMLELPVYEPGSQSASTYLYYLMQAPRQHPSGYTTTAPIRADAVLRALEKDPCPYLDPLGITTIVTHYGRPNPCGGRLIARAGRMAVYRR